MDTIFFRKNCCVECDTPIQSGFLCAGCTPPDPQKLNKISDMKVGDVGYTEPYAVFELDCRLYLIGSASIAPEREDYKTTKIVKGTYEFKIDINTIDQNDIQIGLPDLDAVCDYYIAKLV